MYNVHTYEQKVEQQKLSKQIQDNKMKWLLKRELEKDKALNGQSMRLSFFLKEQQRQNKKVEDDHYNTWRLLKLYRDVENPSKFLGFKAFRYKPNEQMGKSLNERQRKQRLMQSERKKSLVEAKIIPKEQINRNLRCQGPLNQKVSFRAKSIDSQCLQPRMRFKNITDSQRISENNSHFYDKMEQTYKSFRISKSKIGDTKISKKPSEQDHIAINGIDSAISQSTQQQKNNQSIKEKKIFISDPNKPKTYFKLAKTVSLYDPKLSVMLKKSQYDRQKDMSNIIFNFSSENYHKPAIL